MLFLIWDTVRASELSLYGYPRTTSPGLARLARRGVVFDRAMAPASYTLPSHASIFTGRWPHELSADWLTPLNDEPVTIGEVLARVGYVTSAFSANRYFVTRAYGLDRGFAHFDEERLSVGEMLRCSTLVRTFLESGFVRRAIGFNDILGRVTATDSHRALVRWLEGSRGRPYFAFVNFLDAHFPYLPVAPFDTAFGSSGAAAAAADRRRLYRAAHGEPPGLSERDAVRLQAAYDGAVAELDAATDSLLSDLERRGLLRNTIIIVAGDHGEEFGEHTQFGHGNDLFLQSLHVPLVLAYPGHIPDGIRVSATVSLRDLAATIVDLTSTRAELPGQSLRAFWDSTSPPRRAENVLAELRTGPGIPASAPVAKGDMVSVITDSLQLIRDGTGADSVFDLIADPLGQRGAEVSRDVLIRLRAALPRSLR